MILPRRLTELLGDPHFLRLWLIGLFSMGSRWLEMLVVGIFAFETTGSPVLVALLVILRMLPLAVFGSIVGTFADRVAPRFLLYASLVTATLVSLAVLGLALSGMVAYWHIALATFLSGVVWTTDMPVRRRLIGDVAGPERIAAGMSLDSATSNATRLIGPLFGGLLYQWLGLGGAFGLAAALYAICLIITPGVPKAFLASGVGQRSARLLGEFGDGFRYLAREAEVRRILYVTVIFNIWGFPFVSMIPVIGTEKLGLSAAAIGGLAALEGGGAFAGALLIATFGPRPGWYRRLYFFGTASYSAFAFVVGWMTETAPMAVVIFMAGLGAAGFSTMQTTLIYGIAPPGDAGPPARNPLSHDRRGRDRLHQYWPHGRALRRCQRGAHRGGGGSGRRLPARPPLAATLARRRWPVTIAESNANGVWWPRLRTSAGGPKAEGEAAVEIEERTEGTAVVVSLNGRLDGASGPDLEARIAAIVERGDVRVVLECGQMAYVSSAGLRVLLISARKCQQGDGKLAIAALQPECRSVMEMSGFLSIIECHETNEAALAAVA